MNVLSGGASGSSPGPAPTQVGALRAFRPASPTESLLQTLPAAQGDGAHDAEPCQVLRTFPSML